MHRLALLALAVSCAALFTPRAHAVCGDGVIDGSEVCDRDLVRHGFQFNVTGLDCTDFGYDYGTLGCVDCLWSWTDCRDGGYIQLCGNGTVEPYELCDGGANCSQTCTCVARDEEHAVCGNQCRDEGEVCDDNPDDEDHHPCTSSCTWSFLCGDGFHDVTEECDEGPSNSDSVADRCRTSCLLPSCGDNVADTGEECDDGTDNSDLISDRCRTNCRSPRCGDSVIDVGHDEQCDRGAENADTITATCNSVCLVPACGNGYREPWEVCDDGNAEDRDGCNASCTSEEICGNNVVDTAVGETCDDGNLEPGDGCRADCTLEACGDGRMDAFEDCDDGGRADGDGCDARCAVEDGYTCEGEPSVCTHVPADAGTDDGTDDATDAGADAGVDGGIDTGADGGIDTGADGGIDTGVDGGIDTGTGPSPSAGCGCATSGARGSAWLVLFVAGLAYPSRRWGRRLGRASVRDRSPRSTGRRTSLG